MSRLAALKRSGEEDWKRKISRQKNEDYKFANNQNRDSNNSEAVENNKNVENDKNEADIDAEAPLRRSKGVAVGRQLGLSPDNAARPVSLVERLSQVCSFGFSE